MCESMCIAILRSIVTKMQKLYVFLDNCASRFQYIMPTLCDTIPEHVFEDNLVNIGWVEEVVLTTNCQSFHSLFQLIFIFHRSFHNYGCVIVVSRLSNLSYTPQIVSASYTTYCDREGNLAGWVTSFFIRTCKQHPSSSIKPIQQASNLWASNYRLYYPTINTDTYDTAGIAYDLEQHELTTGTNVPIYTLL